MKRLSLILCLLPTLALAQPPAASDKPVMISANGTIKPLTVNGHVPDLPAGTTLNGLPISTGGGTWGSITGTLSNQTDLNTALGLKALDSAVVHNTGTESVGGVKTFTSSEVGISGTEPHLLFTNSDGTQTRLSSVRGLNAGHSLMALSPNGALAFAGPGPIDPLYGFGMIGIESNYVDGGKSMDEFYFTTTGNKRVFLSARNETDGTAQTSYYGGLTVYGTATGLRNVAGVAMLDIRDNQTGFSAISLLNENSTSKGARLTLGAAGASTTGWDLTEDQAQNGTHKFSICNRVLFTFPFFIDSSDRVAIGHGYSDSISDALDVNGTIKATSYKSNDGTAGATGTVSDWAFKNGLVTTIGTLGSASDTAFASSWDSVTGTAPSKNAVYDWAHTFDTDDDGKPNVLDQAAGIAVTNSSGVLQTPITDNSTNWDTAYTDRLKWDGGATGLVAATGRTSLGLVIGTNVQAYDADLDTWAGVTPGTGVATLLATPSSANLRSAITDENGTGVALFDGATNPTFAGATVTGGTVTTSNPVLNATQTWNASGVTFTGIKSNITDTASASGSLLLDLQVGGVSKLTVDKGGNVVSAGGTFKTAAGDMSLGGPNGTMYFATSNTTRIYLGAANLNPSSDASMDFGNASQRFRDLFLSRTLTLSGILVTTPQALSGAGAVNVTTGATALTSTGAAQALTLADGTNGQIKTLAHVVDGGSAVLTPTTKSGYSTITFTNAGDSVTLQFFTTAGWCVMGSYGATIAP